MTKSYRDIRNKEALLEALDPDLKAVIAEGINEYLGRGAQLLLELLMQAEVQTLCGKNHERFDGRTCVRWGEEVGTAIIDGAKRTVKRPRVRALRTLNGEVQLETYKAMNTQELVDGPLTAAILAGVSSRNYENIVARGLEAKGISKSTVSRKAIASTKPTVDEFRNRRIHHLDLVALFFDGVHIAKRQVIVCIGVDSHGKKHVLGLRNGASENATVCQDLIDDLKEKGLNTETNYLFVIDGSRSLARVIRAAFGQDAAIQRCQEHKIRNVLAYLPRKHWNDVRSKMMAAYNEKTEKQASDRFMKLRGELIPISEAAVNALTEGLFETLTVHRLQVVGSLRKALRTTNAIESAFASVRRYMRNVKRFRSESDIDLWLTRSLLETERHFRIIPGHRQLKTLKKHLAKYSTKKHSIG